MNIFNRSWWLKWCNLLAFKSQWSSRTMEYLEVNELKSGPGFDNIAFMKSILFRHLQLRHSIVWRLSRFWNAQLTDVRFVYKTIWDGFMLTSINPYTKTTTALLYLNHNNRGILCSSTSDNVNTVYIKATKVADIRNCHPLRGLITYSSLARDNRCCRHNVYKIQLIPLIACWMC